MDLSSLVFALGLFSAGIWLIFKISGDFKEKKRQVQRIPNAPRRSPRAARHAATASAQMSTASSTRQSSTPPSNSVSNPLAAAEQVGVMDPLQNLSVSVLRETFERFSREL